MNRSGRQCRRLHFAPLPQKLTWARRNGRRPDFARRSAKPLSFSNGPLGDVRNVSGTPSAKPIPTLRSTGLPAPAAVRFGNRSLLVFPSSMAWNGSSATKSSPLRRTHARPSLQGHPSLRPTATRKLPWHVRRSSPLVLRSTESTPCSIPFFNRVRRPIHLRFGVGSPTPESSRDTSGAVYLRRPRPSSTFWNGCWPRTALTRQTRVRPMVWCQPQDQFPHILRP